MLASRHQDLWDYHITWPYRAGFGMAKVWIAAPTSNTYGGVYYWRDREAMQEFGKTELFQSVANHPNLSGITSTDFEVIEGPTRVNHGFPAAG